MRTRRALLLAVMLSVPATAALAQPAPEPPPLRLPEGARVRLQTTAAPGSWVEGVLASADASRIAVVPAEAPPLGDNQLVLPSASVTRFELATGKQRQWLRGLVIGGGLGLALGFAVEVDDVACQYDEGYACSRGEALALMGGTFAVLGAGVGALVTTDRWTPVAIDALAPPAPRVSGVVPRLRALPRGGVELAVALGF